MDVLSTTEESVQQPITKMSENKHIFKEEDFDGTWVNRVTDFFKACRISCNNWAYVTWGLVWSTFNMANDIAPWGSPPLRGGFSLLSLLKNQKKRNIEWKLLWTVCWNLIILTATEKDHISIRNFRCIFRYLSWGRSV